MKEFRLETDIFFEAEDIVEACKMIIKHFQRIADLFSENNDDVPEPEEWFIGNIELGPTSPGEEVDGATE